MLSCNSSVTAVKWSRNRRWTRRATSRLSLPNLRKKSSTCRCAAAFAAAWRRLSRTWLSSRRLRVPNTPPTASEIALITGSPARLVISPAISTPPYEPRSPEWTFWVGVNRSNAGISGRVTASNRSRGTSNVDSG